MVFRIKIEYFSFFNDLMINEFKLQIIFIMKKLRMTRSFYQHLRAAVTCSIKMKSIKKVDFYFYLIFLPTWVELIADNF